MPTANELPINTSASAEDMANAISGAGVTVESAQYFGDDRSSGIYDDTGGVATDVLPGETGVILSTGRAEDFTNSDGSTDTNQATNTGTNTSGIDNDVDFNALAGRGTRDASFLEVEFRPTGDFLTIDFVISSEEYPEFVISQFLDVVGVWVNGVEAQVSIGDGTASVGNINGANTPNLYNDNTSDQFNTEMDGFTITLTFVAPVNAGAINTLKIGVADVSDSGYDTNLLIAGGSVQSTIVAQDDAVSLGNNDTQTVDVLSNDSSSGGTLTVTHINGVRVFAGDAVTLGTGQDITLNSDGTFTVEGDSDNETVYFTYDVEDTSGNTDTALVEITQVPCFTAGTPIETPNGPRAVETLRAGDLVLTPDAGALPVLWVGSSHVAPDPRTAPIRIRAGHYGAMRDVIVSPNHRILVSDMRAELLFGEPEVLVRAKHLVDGRGVLREDPAGPVTYFHILLETHQMLISDGLVSESYQPGAMTFFEFDIAVQREIAQVLPGLAEDPDSYGTSARMSLKAHEARPLLETLAA